MIWLTAAFATLIISCLLNNWNRTLQKHPAKLNFWRSTIAVAIMLPIIPFIKWPSDISFYIVATMVGVVSGYIKIVTFDLAAKFNGRIASLSGPITIVMTYIAWSFITEAVNQTTLQFLLSTAFLIASILTLIYMSKNGDNTGTKSNPRQYLVPLCLASILGMAMTVITKLYMPSNVSSEWTIKIVALTFIIFITQMIYSILDLIYRDGFNCLKNLAPKEYITTNTVLLAITGLAGAVTSWVAISLASNPAHVQAIIATTPVALLAYHKFAKIEDNTSPIASVLLVIFVIGLILI